MDRLPDLHWITSVFDEAAVEFEVVSLLTPDVLLNANLRDKVGEEIAYLIHEHLELELRYRSMLNQPGGAVGQAPSDQLFDCSLQICDSLRALCRRFHAAPHLLQNLDRSRRPVDQPWYQVLQQVAKFFHITRTRLLAFADDDSAPAEGQLDELNASVHDERQRESALTQQLAKHRADHSARMAQCDANLGKLQRDIEKARVELQVRAQRLRQEMETADTDLRLDREANQARIGQMPAIGARLDQVRLESVERENKLRKELRRVHLETDDTIGKYDDAMIRMTSEIEALTAAYDNDLIKIREMRSLAEALVAERDAHLERMREIQMRLEEEERLRNESATAIQRVFRGWKTRRDLAKAKAKSKSKGKGKKKK